MAIFNSYVNVYQRVMHQGFGRTPSVVWKAKFDPLTNRISIERQDVWDTKSRNILSDLGQLSMLWAVWCFPMVPNPLSQADC